MSRLNEIIDNHKQLNDLFSMLKHYAVSAEFVSYALIEQFKKKRDEEQENEESPENEDEQQYTDELLEDLNQFYLRF